MLDTVHEAMGVASQLNVRWWRSDVREYARVCVWNEALGIATITIVCWLFSGTRSRFVLSDLNFWTLLILKLTLFRVMGSAPANINHWAVSTHFRRAATCSRVSPSYNNNNNTWVLSSEISQSFIPYFSYFFFTSETLVLPCPNVSPGWTWDTVPNEMARDMPFVDAIKKNFISNLHFLSFGIRNEKA